MGRATMTRKAASNRDPVGLPNPPRWRAMSASLEALAPNGRLPRSISRIRSGELDSGSGAASPREAPGARRWNQSPKPPSTK
jgi:hypothetical protein